MAYIRAIQTGNYSNPATWAGGVVPSSGDIACSGSYRVTIDQNVLAVISATNYDWVSAGGATLSTTHTGGFTLQAESNFSIAGMNYEVYRTTTASAASSDLLAANASFTITGIITCVNTTSNTTASANIYISATNASNTYTYNFNGNIYLLGGTTTRSSQLIYVLNTSNSSKYVINFYGAILASNSNVYACNWLISSNTVAPVSIDITFHSSIITNALINIPLSTVPVGNANITFKNKNISQGTFTIASGSTISNFRNITFEQGIYLADDVGTVAPFTFSASTLIHSIGNIEIINAARTYVIFQGTAAVVIDGDIIRNPNYTADTGIAVQFNNSDTVTVNGILRELASVQTAAGTSTSNRLVAILANVTAFTCLGIVGVGYCNIALSISAANAALSVTVNGNVDYSQANSNAVNIRAIHLTSTSVSLLVTGNVYAATQGSTIFYDQGTIHADTNFNSLRVEGTVYGSSRTPGIAITSGVTAVNTLFVNKLVASDDNIGTAYPVPAGYSAIVPYTVNELVCGQTGRFPINGQFFFKDTTTAVIRARDSLFNEILLLEQVGNTIPNLSDIREGVAIGGGVGTLVLPEPSEVKVGVTYGNNQTGTYDIYTGVVSNLVSIKEKTDKLSFTELVTGSEGDVLLDNVGFLSNFENYGSTSFLDATGKSINLLGTTIISDLASNTGKYSLYCKPNGAVNVPYHTSMDMLAGDFTIEIVVAFLDLSSGGSRILSASGNQLAWANHSGIHWLLQAVLNGGFQFSFNNASWELTVISSTTVPATGKWYHLAVTRQGNTLRLFVDGVLESTLTTTMARPNDDPVLSLGSIYSESISSANFLNGFIDRVRLTKGVNRYSSTYTVSTKPFSTVETFSPDYELITSGFSGSGGSVDLTPVTQQLSIIQLDTAMLKALAL